MKLHSAINDLLNTRYIENGELENKTLKEIQADLKKIRPALDYVWREAWADDFDKRSGHETYGYKNLAHIKSKLKQFHIRKQWDKTSRLRWLLDLIDVKEGKK